MLAYDTHIDTGAEQTAAMLLQGPTAAHLLTLREAGVLPAHGPANLWIGQLLAGRSALALPVPPAGGSPEQNAAWWASLPPSVQQALIAATPGALGNLNGLPAWARDRANRARLVTERARITAEIVRLQAKLDRHRGAPGFRVAYHDELQRIPQLERKLASLDAIERTLARGGRQLLLLDLSGERAEAAVAIGDVDTADHVAVFTPGLYSTVDEYRLERYDTQMALLQERAQEQADLYSPGATVATVTWIGYQAPQSFPESALAGQAEAGADELAGFYRGINASRENDPHLTAIGHSYGSTTAGLATQHPDGGVDDAVFIGSPGIGTSDVSDLQVPEGHTYVVEARGDLVADLARYGEDPNTMEGVTNLSAREETARGEQLRETTGHDTQSAPGNPQNGYLAPGTASQYNVSTVVAGLPDKAVHDRGVGLGDWLW